MRERLQKLINETSRIVLDKDKEIKQALLCILADGHLLIEDSPGVGKTLLVQTLGKLLGLNTKRVQFTVDLLPGDVIGGQIYSPKDQQFYFFEGPIFSQLIIADELNRASPRTQGALLQAMEEKEVSVDGKTISLPSPFFVIATQNPFKDMGTFSLPLSQLDRFMMSIELNYASKETEVKILQGEDPRQKLKNLERFFSENELLSVISKVQEVKLGVAGASYIACLLENSRNFSVEGLRLSTRAGMSLARAAKAHAFFEGRDYVRVEDVQELLIPVLAHRLGGDHGIRRGREMARTLKEATSIPL
jgi:MoxR-like ATPase